MFDDKQKELLSAPLDSRVTKTLEEGPMKGAVYIEAYHAIYEANRIFGFDGWSCETLVMECTSTANYEKPGWNGKPPIPMIEVGYNCKVRVTAGGVVREGYGSGAGQGKRPAQAHESASKEAESDAIKRALRSFGNQFGLALYDKAKTNVETDADRAKPKRRSKAEARDDYARIQKLIDDAPELRVLAEVWGKSWPAIATMPTDFQDEITQRKDDRKHELSTQQAA